MQEKQHLFLTGEIQIGKSTCIQRFLDFYPNLQIGGFLTYFGPDRKQADRLLYIREAGQSPIYEKRQAIASFSDGIPTPLPKQFDALGVAYLEKALQTADCVIMDECGSLEKKAFLFQKKILEILDRTIPVLGVLKQNCTGFVDQIKNHEKVSLLFVTLENRENIPKELSKWYKKANEKMENKKNASPS